MIKHLLRLWLAVSLIVAASAVLLFTDREPRVEGADRRERGPAVPARRRSVALFQHVSQATLEEGAAGCSAG